MYTDRLDIFRQYVLSAFALRKVQKWLLVVVFLLVVTFFGVQGLKVMPLFKQGDNSHISMQAVSSTDSAALTEKDYNSLAEQLWFGAPVQQAVEVEEVAQETTLNLELKATIAGGAFPRAVILDVSSGKSQMLKINEDVLPGVKLTKVERRHVLLDNRGKREALSLPQTTLGRKLPNPDSIGNNKSVASANRTEKKSTYIPLEMRKVDTYQKITISKLDAVEALANLGSLSKQARSIPVVSPEHGVQGYKFTRMDHDSIFKKISLREGDTVVFVNGVHVKNKEKIFPILTSLAKADKVTLVFERLGKMISLEVSLN